MGSMHKGREIGRSKSLVGKGKCAQAKCERVQIRVQQSRMNLLHHFSRETSPLLNHQHFCNS